MNKHGLVLCTHLGVSGYYFKKTYFLSEDLLYLYSVDPDEMQHYAAFHLGLHCLQRYSFRGFPEYKGLGKGYKLKVDFFFSFLSDLYLLSDILKETAPHDQNVVDLSVSL